MTSSRDMHRMKAVSVVLFSDRRMKRGPVKFTFCLLRIMCVAALVLCAPASVGADEDEPQGINSGEANLLYMRGRQHVMDGEYEKAIPLLEKAIAGDPANAFINHQLSELYLRTGKLEQAESLGRKSVEKEPENVEYRATYGGVLAALRKYDEAKAQYVRIREIDPTNAKAVLLIGILEAESGQMDAGVKTLSRAIKENEDNFMAYFYRAKIYLELEQVDKAKSDLAKCQTIRPAFIEAGTALGLLHERLGEVDDAIKAYSSIRGNGRFRKRLAQLYLQKNEFEKALAELLEYEQIEPDDYTTRVKVGLLFFEMKKFGEAKERFQIILKEQPEADNVQFYLAAVHEELKEWPQALKHFQKVTKSSSFYKEAMLHIGFIYRQNQRFEDGLNFSRKLVKDAPDVVEFYDMQATFLESKQKYKEAMAVLSQGLKRFPADEKLVYFQGAIFEKQGERAKAIEVMKGLLKTNPKNAHALNFLGYTYTESGENLEEAEAYIREALALRPEDGFIEDSLGWVLFKRGKTEEGLKHLERALKLQPEEAIVHEHLGDVYASLKEFAKATAAYQKAYELSVKRDKDQAKKIEQKLAGLPMESRTPSAKSK
jgi:tetratricopeptide (TPR) repeat protein